MAFEIVDGMTGTKHISSDDLSALNVATIGKANCVLEYGDDFKLTMASANSATLGTGVGMVGGKRFWNQAATSLTVQSGTQDQKRNDLVVARYAKTSAGIESITPVVIKGKPSTGTAEDPNVTANDLKLWRIPLNGISVGTPVKLFDPMASLATLKHSVSLHDNTLYNGPWPIGGTITVPGFSKYKIFIFNVSNWGDPNLISIPTTTTFNASEIDCWDTNSANAVAVGAMRITRQGDNLRLLAAGRINVNTNYAYPYGGNVRIIGLI